MKSYLEDILSQSSALKGSIESLYKAGVEDTIKAMCSKPYKKIVFAGMGSSNYCSWAAGILLSQHGVSNIRVSAGELLHYEYGLLDKDTLLILTSQSGESVEILGLIDKIPEGCTVAAVTNNPESPLAKRGDYRFILGVEEEAAVTTRTYISSLMIMNLIAFALTGRMPGDFLRRASLLPEKMDAVFARHDEITHSIESFLGFPANICLLGRGASLSTIEAGTLFLREVVKYPAFGSDSGEFRHGPMEMVDETFSGILISPDGVTFELQRKLALDIAEKGGKSLFISMREHPVQHKNIKTILLPCVEEWASPILTIIPVQLYAERFAKIRGVTPGVFRWGSKITKAE